MRTGRPRTPLAERFWALVDTVPNAGSCWLWQGQEDAYGYGAIRRDPADSSKAKAHRVAWELCYGPVPAGQCVLHRCDVRRCVRPSHLFLGTIADNIRDMYAKGRNRKKGWKRRVSA